MKTQKILSTITLFALNLLPFSSAKALPGVELMSITHGSTPGSAAPVATPKGASAPRQEEPPAELPAPGKRPLSLGFAADSPLRRSLLNKLAAGGRYDLQGSQQISDHALGLFVGGFVSEAKPEHGWLNCHARYFVASQPTLAALQVESVAASVPIMTVRVFRDRPELLQLAEESCFEQLAEQIADGIRKLPE